MAGGLISKARFFELRKKNGGRSVIGTTLKGKKLKTGKAFLRSEGTRVTRISRKDAARLALMGLERGGKRIFKPKKKLIGINVPKLRRKK